MSGVVNYITGRGRNINKSVAVRLPGKYIYNLHPVDYSMGWLAQATCVPSIITDGIGVTADVNIVDEGGPFVGSRRIEYGLGFYLGGSRVLFLKQGQVLHGQTLGTITTPSTGISQGIQFVSWVAECTWEYLESVVELLLENGSLFDVQEPGTTAISDRITGGTGATPSGPQDFGVVTVGAGQYWSGGIVDYVLRFGIKATSFAYYPITVAPGYTSSFDIAALHAACAAAAVAIHAEAPMVYSSTTGNGMVNPSSGLAMSCAIGSGDWGVVDIAAPAAGYISTAQNYGDGFSESTIRYDVRMRRFEQPNDIALTPIIYVQPDRLVSQPGADPYEAAYTTDHTGVVAGFTQDVQHGGFTVHGTWSTSWSGPNGSNAGSQTYNQTETTIPTDPKAKVGQGVGNAQAVVNCRMECCPSLGFRFAQKNHPFSLQQAASKIWHGFGGIDWATTGTSPGPTNGDKWFPFNCTLAVIGGGASGSKLKISGITSGNSIELGYSNAAHTGLMLKGVAYRYWDFRIRSVGVANANVTLGWFDGLIWHYWQFTTGADSTWVTRRMDLFGDGYTVNPPTSGDPHRRITPVFRVSFLLLSQLDTTAGAYYEIESITGVRQSETLLSHCVPGRELNQGIRALHGTTDGHLSFNPLWDPNQALSTTPITGITQLKTRLDSWPWSGFVMTPLLPAPTVPAADGNYYIGIDQLPNMGCALQHVAGNSLLRTPPGSSDTDFDIYLNKDAASALSVVGQPFWPGLTGVFVPPGAGDFLNHSDHAYGSVIRADAEGIVHARLFGCVIPASGGVTTKVRPGLASTGAGGARASGYYDVAYPRVQAWDAFSISGPVVETEARCTAQLRYWFDSLPSGSSFAPAGTTLPQVISPAHGDSWYLRWHVIPGEGISQDISPAGLHVRVESGSGGTIHAAFREDYPGAAWSDLDTLIAGEFPCIRFDPSHDYQRLWLSYVDSGAVKLAYSDDGGTWTVATTVSATGDKPTMDVTPWGVQLHLWLDSDAIVGQIMDPQNNVLVGSITAVASGADDAPITVVYDPAADRWFLQYRVSGAITLKTSVDGVTWT